LEKLPLAGERFFKFNNFEEAEGFFKSEEEPLVFQKEKEESGEKILNIILKTDCMGSLEAIDALLNTLSQEKISLRIIKKEVGDFKENDIKEAKEKYGIK
jgi:translation initiation factor IF-2